MQFYICFADSLKMLLLQKKVSNYKINTDNEIQQKTKRKKGM